MTNKFPKPKTVELYHEGQILGKCIFIKEVPSDGRRTALFKCYCGKEFIARIYKVKNRCSGCGCRKGEKQKNEKFLEKILTTHGYSIGGMKSEYKTWAGLKDRCCNSNSKSYKNYGGRGIKVCDRWLESFQNFIEDMGDKPSDKHSIDRIDVNGNYCPENCRWATIKEQNNNTRANVILEYNGESLTLAEWAEKLDMNRGTIGDRYRKGLPVHEILSTVKKKNQFG